MNEQTRLLPMCRNRNLAEEIGRFLEHCRLAGRSARTVEALDNGLWQLRRFLDGEGVHDAREVTADMLRRYKAHTVVRISPQSAHLYLRTVRAFFRFLTDEHRLLIDPAEGLAMPKLNRRGVGAALSEAEMERLIAMPDVATPTGLRDRAMLEFLYSTALRVSELCRMGVGDVDPAGGTARVTEGKGARDRVAPIGTEAGKWLSKYLAEARPLLVGDRDVDALFVSYRGRAWSDQMAAIHLKDLGRAAGLRVNLTCHVIRRTTATRLLSRGASPVEVSALLGHRDVRSLGRYVAVVARELKDAHRATHPREQEHD